MQKPVPQLVESLHPEAVTQALVHVLTRMEGRRKVMVEALPWHFGARPPLLPLTPLADLHVVPFLAVMPTPGACILRCFMPAVPYTPLKCGSSEGCGASAFLRMSLQA